MSVSIFKKLRIKLLELIASPTHVLVTDAEGNVGKAVYTTAFPAPVLRELVPDTYLPSTTGNFILRGSFFTPIMTISIEGHTYNYWEFVSSNEVKVNLTTSATEGTYDVTLNNGISATFSDVLQIVNGTVYQPTDLDWINITGNIDTDNDNLLLKVNGSLGYAEWNRIFDVSKNFEIQLTSKWSPIAVDGGFNSVFLIQLIDVVTGDIYKLKAAYNSGSLTRFDLLKNTTSIYNFISTSQLLPKNLKFNYNTSSNVMGFYINNVLRYSFANTEFANNVRPVFNVQWYYDIYDIKYIDLSDVTGGYTDYEKVISQFVNDSKYIKISDLSQYANDAAAASGGVAIGEAYINSSTGAIQSRLT